MLRHRHKLVGFRTSAMNQLHALDGQGVCRRKKLLDHSGGRELLQLLDAPMGGSRSGQAVEKEAASCPEAILLMNQKGVGPVSRFPGNRQARVSYLGLNPSEDSSGAKNGCGISKQGNSMMRWLLVEGRPDGCAFHAELRGLSALEVSPWAWGGQGGHRPENWPGAAVLEVTRTDQLQRRRLAMQGSPESVNGGRKSIDLLMSALPPLAVASEFRRMNHGL